MGHGGQARKPRPPVTGVSGISNPGKPGTLSAGLGIRSSLPFGTAVRQSTFSSRSSMRNHNR